VTGSTVRGTPGSYCWAQGKVIRKILR